MKKNNLILLLGALAITGGAAFWKYQKRSKAIGDVPPEVGSYLLKDFNAADVGSFTVKDSKGEVTIEQKDGKWVVPARDGFPAAIQAVNELRDNAQGLRIGQVQRVGDSRFGQLKLKKPGDGGTEEETGTMVSFRDASGKDLKAFVAGKVMSQDETPPGGFNMNPSGPKSQYIKVMGTDGSVFIARDGFTRLETDIKNWLDKNAFFKVEKIKSVTVTGASSEESWKIFRDSEAGELKLDAPTTGEAFEAAKASPVSSAFAFTQFDDVLPAADAAKAKMDAPLRTAVIETFDGFTYTVKVGAPEGENHYMSYTVDAKFPETRTPPEPKEKDKPAETEEEKKKADEAFAKDLETKKKKLAEEQAQQSRIFIMAKSSLEPILKKRPDFMKDKPAPGAAPVEAKPPLPGQAPKIEAVTPPVSVDVPAAAPATPPATPAAPPAAPATPPAAPATPPAAPATPPAEPAK